MARDDQVDSRFKDLLAQFEKDLRETADLDRLKGIRRQIRKSLPFAVRAYLPAYLLQEAVGPGTPKRARSDRPRGSRRGRPTGERRQPEPAGQPQGDDDSADTQMARLFVSVGRSRRVSREGLTELFVDRLQLRADDVGEVRVLDNYSFIELRSGIADKAIAEISGETLNGRRLNVDYARNKKG